MEDKIIICISKGNLTEVFSNNKNIKVELIDFDNLSFEMDTVDQDTLFEQATKDLKQLDVYDVTIK